MRTTLKMFVLGMFLSFAFAATAQAAPPQPINPVLSTDQSNPAPVKSTQTYEFTNPRPYFDMDIRTIDSGTLFISEPDVQRSGPDEAGNYHFVFTVEAAPVQRTLRISATSSEHDGLCSSDPMFCETAEYFARATGPQANPFREIGLVAKQSGCRVTSKYSFIAGAPAVLVHKVVLYAQFKGKPRRSIRATAFRAGVYSAARSNIRQASSVKPLNICTSFMRRKLKSLESKGARLTFEARAYLLADGRKVGLKIRKARLRRR